MKTLEFTLDTAHFGRVLVGRPLPVGGDSWGRLAPLRGTPWGDLLPVVQGEDLSAALHGDAQPLMQSIGREPRILLRLVPEPRYCAEFKRCITKAEKDCHPCATVPDCYEPPGLPPEARSAANYLVRMWREGRYVIIVEGEEFVL